MIDTTDCNPTSHPFVMMIDDDEADAFVTHRALKMTKWGDQLEFQHMESGEQFIDEIRLIQSGVGRVPDLILLDVNMPRMNGFEVLEKLQKLHLGADVPIVIFSTSQSEDDLTRAMDLGAAGFSHKPDDLAGMTDLALRLAKKWLHVPARQTDQG